MYTNIDLDPALVDQAMRLTGIRTKKALVEAGLRALVALHDQREVRDLRGRLHWQGEGGAAPASAASAASAGAKGRS